MIAQVLAERPGITANECVAEVLRRFNARVTQNYVHTTKSYLGNRPVNSSQKEFRNAAGENEILNFLSCVKKLGKKNAGKILDLLPSA